MTDTSDERLAAWLDGALSEHDAAAFVRELARDPRLAARAARWRANDRRLADAFAPLAQGGIDAAMLDRLGLGPQDGAAPKVQPSFAQAANDNPPWWKRYRLPLSGAVAASAAAAVLLGMPHGLGEPLDPLSRALDTTPSLAQADLGQGRTIVPTLTVRARDGRWCREYRGGGRVALACRDNGRWKVEAEGAETAATPGDDYALAGGPDGAVLESAYRRIGASDPIDANAETRAIQAHWRAAP